MSRGLTMLRTNSKKAIDAIKKYIVDNCDGTNHGVETPKTFKEAAAFIYSSFISEYYNSPETRRYFGWNEAKAFASWCAGLPSVIDTCYYYNRSAVEDIAVILEENENEKSRFSESQAEELLTSLIYREIKKAVGGVRK